MTPLVKKILLTCIFLVVMVHAMGILLPETGFDALWYHLPIVKDMAESRQIRVIPQVSQSDQPRLGEILFLPWFILFGVTGVKLCAFLLMLLLLWLTYRLAANYLSQSDALVLTLLVATFHTVAWQASSAYVDLLRTNFELGILILLSHLWPVKHENWALALLLAGAVLTKLVTLIFLPGLLIYVWLKRGYRTALMLAGLTALIYFVGRFPVSFFMTAGHELIGPESLTASLRSLMLLPLELSFHAESYTTPLFLLAVPFLVYQHQWLWKRIRSELLFLAASLATWVFVVPVSVRYDLSTIILAAVICFAAVLRATKTMPFPRTIFYGFIGISLVLNLSIRIGAYARALPYLLGTETEGEYLKRFNQGILKGPLEKWYLLQ